MAGLRVLQTGPYATIQDLGRFGYQQYGVPVSGVLDRLAAITANLLVGNAPGAAVVEMTFAGMKLTADGPLIVAVTGADMPLTINDEPRDGWTAVALAPGDVLTVKPARSGLRGYLAVGGGFQTPLVMGSASTYVGGAIGGLEGRVLAKGDRLPCGGGGLERNGLSLPPALRPAAERRITLRALPGPQDDRFDQGLEMFFGQPFKVSSKADRMGYRLEGPKIDIKPGLPGSIISEPSLAGAVQIPADGQPIVLLVEQTVGGYAKIATVISADLDLVAQARPGDEVRFERVDLEAARQAAAGRRELLAHITRAMDRPVD